MKFCVRTGRISCDRSLFGNHSGDALSTAPVLARDGQTVIFASFATDLAPADFNQLGDLFLVRLPGPESDFRIISVARPSSGQVTLIWSAQENRTYRVEFTEALASGWQILNVPVQIAGKQAVAVDAAARPIRFYRIVDAAP